jgi:hypothetical protein
VKKLVIGVFVCALASACGSSSPTGPSAPPVYEESVVGTAASFGWVQHALTTPRAGNLTVTLTWGSGGDLDLYLTNQSCNQYPQGNCQILGASDAAFGATETIRRTVSQGETFKVWVDNFALFPIGYTLRLRID